MKIMDTGETRQFIQVTDGRIGAIIANDRSGGVLRGHCDIWFGAFTNDSKPLIEQLLVEDEWEVIEAPIGRSKDES